MVVNMSKFYDAINWLQNGEIQLLFFIVGYKGDLNSIPEIKMTNGQNLNFYDYSEDSDYPIAMLEIRAKDEENSQSPENIVQQVFSMFNNRPEILICMFDGSYLSAEDLIDNKNYAHIYAIKTPDIEKFGFSDEHRYSDNWKSDVKLVQQQIIDSYQLR